MADPSRPVSIRGVPAPDEELAPVDALLLYGDADPRRRSSLIGLCMLERAPEWPALMATVERAAPAHAPAPAARRQPFAADQPAALGG